MHVWYYSISRGVFSGAFDDTPLYPAYSGQGISRDNPDHISIAGFGPIPPGLYRCLNPRDHPTLGRGAVPLEPHRTTQVFGRSGFFIHGDNGRDDKSASRGCIVTQFAARGRITGGDILVVLP